MSIAVFRKLHIKPFSLLLFSLLGQCYCAAVLAGSEDGLVLKLISLGDTRVEVRVENNGLGPQFLLNLFKVPYHMLAFKIQDPDGKKVPFRGALNKLPFQIENLIYLEPGGFMGKQMDLRDLSDKSNKRSGGHYKLEQGLYRVTAIYDMRGMKNQFEGVQLWDGRLVSNEIVLSVEKQPAPILSQ